MVEYLTTREIATATRTSPGFWHGMRSNGGGPKFIKIGAAVRYRLEDVETWLAEREYSNAAQAKAASLEEVTR